MVTVLLVVSTIVPHPMSVVRGKHCGLAVNSIKFDLQGILVSGLCPGAEDPAECEAALPGLWAGIAALLWPNYWEPTVSWTVNLSDSSHLDLC